MSDVLVPPKPWPIPGLAERMEQEMKGVTAGPLGGHPDPNCRWEDWARLALFWGVGCGSWISAQCRATLLVLPPRALGHVREVVANEPGWPRRDEGLALLSAVQPRHEIKWAETPEQLRPHLASQDRDLRVAAIKRLGELGGGQ